MKSNLTINSNLFLRKIETPLAEDKDFLPHVRGVSAVRKLLWKAFEIPSTNANYSDSEVMHLLRSEKITKNQWQILKNSLPCPFCQNVHWGKTFKGVVEFRSLKKDCKQ